MKKKVLSVLLAAALFAGSAVAVNAQVFGSWPVSSQGGLDEDITSMEFSEKTVTIQNGKKKDLKELLTVYVNDKKIVQEPELLWEIDADDDLALALRDGDDAGIVDCYEDKGTAVVTVKSVQDESIFAKITVKATPLKKATGFKAEKTTYSFRVGDAGESKVDTGTSSRYYFIGQTVKLVPTPEGSVFSPEQLQVIENLDVALAYGDKENNYSLDATEFVASGTDGDGYVFKLAGLKDADDPSKGYTHEYEYVDGSTSKAIYDSSAEILISGSGKEGAIEFPTYDGDRNAKTMAARKVRATTVKAVDAERAARSGAITVEVGKTVTLGDYVKFGPTNCNANNSVDGTWTIIYYNDAATIDDFGVVNDDGKFLAVAVGKVKAYNTFTPVGGTKTYEIEIPINIVAKGTTITSETDASAMELSLTAASLEVAGTTWVEVTNAPSDPENIKWTISDTSVATILPESGAGIKVFAKAPGTATLTMTYGDVTKTATITVTAAGAVTPVPAPAGDVENPATGDSLFAHLF